MYKKVKLPVQSTLSPRPGLSTFNCFTSGVQGNNVTQVPASTVSASALNSEFNFIVGMLFNFAKRLLLFGNVTKLNYCVLFPLINRTVPVSMMEDNSFYTVILYMNMIDVRSSEKRRMYIFPIFSTMWRCRR